MVSEAVPVVKGAGPVVKGGAAPVVTAVEPLMGDVEPVVQGDAPAPVVKDAVPVVKGAAPVMGDAAPVVKGAPPVVTSAPPVVTSAPPVVTSAAGPAAGAGPEPGIRRPFGARAFISGASLLAVGVAIGVLIGPGVRAEVAGQARSEAVTHTTPATAAGSTRGPAPTRSLAVPPTLGTGSSSPAIPGGPAPFNPAQPATIGFGDSITYNADSWFRQLCIGGVLLRNCLNAGIRGNTTTQMLARLESDALVYRPAIVIVMGGTNDLKRHESTQAIVRRLDIMVDQARAAGATTVLCTIPPRNTYGPQVLALNAAIRRYATLGNVPLLDLYEPIGTRAGGYKRGMSKDGVHPTLKAADLMTALAEQQLPTLLPPIREAGQVGRLPPNR